MSADGSSGKKPRAPHHSRALVASAAPPAPELAQFRDSVQSFLQEHTVFESSVIIELAVTEIAKMGTLDEVFVVPLSHKLLNYEGSLRWAFFLYHGQKAAVEEGIAFPKSALDLNKAFDRIATVFDLALQAVLWDHLFEGESSEEEGSDEE